MTLLIVGEYCSTINFPTSKLSEIVKNKLFNKLQKHEALPLRKLQKCIKYKYDYGVEYYMTKYDCIEEGQVYRKVDVDNYLLQDVLFWLSKSGNVKYMKILLQTYDSLKRLISFQQPTSNGGYITNMLYQFISNIIMHKHADALLLVVDAVKDENLTAMSYPFNIFWRLHALNSTDKKIINLGRNVLDIATIENNDFMSCIASVDVENLHDVKLSPNEWEYGLLMLVRICHVSETYERVLVVLSIIMKNINHVNMNHHTNLLYEPKNLQLFKLLLALYPEKTEWEDNDIIRFLQNGNAEMLEVVLGLSDKYKNIDIKPWNSENDRKRFLDLHDKHYKCAINIKPIHKLTKKIKNLY